MYSYRILSSVLHFFHYYYKFCLIYSKGLNLSIYIYKIICNIKKLFNLIYDYCILNYKEMVYLVPYIRFSQFEANEVG